VAVGTGVSVAVGVDVSGISTEAGVPKVIIRAPASPMHPPKSRGRVINTIRKMINFVLILIMISAFFLEEGKKNLIIQSLFIVFRRKV
jgi:hypothetical protein